MVSGKIKTYFLGIVSLVAAVSSLFSFVPASAAVGDYKAEWIDRGHIRVFEAHRSSKGVIFTDSNPTDGTHHFVNLDQRTNCRSSLSTPMNSGQRDFEGAPASGKLFSVVFAQATQDNAAQCEVRFDKDGEHAPGTLKGSSVRPVTSSTPPDSNTLTSGPNDDATKTWGGTISINNTGNGVINFRRNSADTIARVDGKIFTQFNNSNTYLEGGSDACRDSVIIEGSRTVEGRRLETGTYRERSGNGDPCNVDKRLSVTIISADDPDLDDVIGEDAETPGTGGDPQATCEASGFSLSWIFCPIINGLAEATEGIFDSFIKPFLQTSPIEVNDTGKPIYQVWSSFRILANIVLVIALLVVVLGQSIGGGLIDAYTAKKVLPRLFAAAILINVSIYIVAFMVDLTNILGEGVGSLITAPFFDGDFLTIKPNFLVQVGGLASFVAGSWALLAVPGFLGFLWVFVLLPALIAMIGVFITLILRQGLILFLIISSPVAFALYCLPNTEKYFKKWWDLLFKALMVYPIIVLLFAVSQILAVTISAANGTSGPRATLGQVAAFVIMFIPLFLIPFAFKMAGGAVASLYGAISGGGNKVGGFIKGNPNDPNSLQSRTRRDMGNAITDMRTGVQNRTSGRGFITRRLGGMVGGGAGTYARQAQHNKEAASRVEDTGNFGNDQYIKGTTIPLAALRDWSNATNPNHGRYRVRNINGRNVEQWQTADNTWLNRQQIEEGHRHYNTGSEKQQAFKYVLGKAEALGPENHERVFEDFVSYANEENLDPGNAAGAWQGIAIPYKGIRADLRRMSPTGTRGNLTAGGVDHHSLNTEFASYLPQQMVQETAGTFDALYNSILQSVTPVATGAVNPNAAPAPGEATYQQRFDKAISAYS